MSGNEGNSGDIAPTFEEQIRHLRKLRGSKGTLFDKTTEHNVKKKLVRELTKSHPQPVIDERLDQRLQQTLNREAGTDMYAMFDSITASITGFKRRETKTFHAPLPPQEEPTSAEASASAEAATASTAHNPAPKLVARATKKYQIYIEGGKAEIRPVSNEQNQPATKIPSKEEDMVLGEARQKPNDDTDGHLDDQFIVGRSGASKGQHNQIRTFPSGAEREIHQLPGTQQRPEVRPSAEHSVSPQVEPDIIRSGQDARAPISGAAITDAPMARADARDSISDAPIQDAPIARADAHDSLSDAPVHDAPIARADARDSIPDAPIQDAPIARADAHDSNLDEPGIGQDSGAPISVEGPIGETSRPRAEGLFVFDTEFIQEMAMFTAQTGLDLVVNSPSSMQVLLTAGGTTTSLHEVPLNEQGIDEARILASSLLNYYMVSLRNDFNIDFGHFGEIAVHQCGLNEKNQLVQTKALFARPPRIDELKAVHAALEYSWPASAQPDEQPPMKILFLNDVLVRGEDVGARLKFGEDGRPILFITPMLCAQGAPTEKDTIDESSDSWQLIIMRELAWKTLADCKKLPLSTEEGESLGWVEVSRKDGLYILATTGGEYFYPNPDPVNPQQAWLKVNKSGEYVDIKGQKITSSSEIIFKSAEEIAVIAIVRPAGMLFHSPEEELADALSRYRLGEKYKASILTRSPALYSLAKEVDQESINRWYVPSEKYSGLIRSASGALVEHTHQNLDQVSRFEQSTSPH